MTQRALLALACVAAFVILVPWQPKIITAPPDSAWQNVLHDAFATGAHFGEEIVFTYGPWGFLTTGYDPRTWHAMLAVWIAIAAAIVLALFEIARLTLDRSWQRAAFVLIVVMLAKIDIGYFTDVPYFLAAIVMLRLHFARGHPAIRAFLAAMLGAIALTKFSFFLAVIVAIAIVLVDDVLARRVPVTAVTFIASLTGFWIAARQPLALFPAFVRNSWEVAAGYSENMSLTFGYREDDILLGLTAVLIAAIVIAAAEESRVYAAGIGAVLLLALKAGAVRVDGHDLITHTTLAVAAIVAAPRNRKMSWCAIAAVALLAYALPARTLPPLATSMMRTLAPHQRNLDRERDELLANVRSEGRPTNCPCDAYPYESDVPIAWNVASSRRPVFQSYSAYSPRLQELNAAHLRGPRAPETLLFRVSGIDKRLPSSEDGASWPEIFARYRVESASGTFLVLRRIHDAKPPRLEPVAQIASSGLTFASLDIHPTLLERIVTTLIRGHPRHIILTTESSAKHRFRIAPGSARALFLVSPLITTNAEFASRSGERVTRIEVEGRASYTLRLFRLSETSD